MGAAPKQRDIFTRRYRTIPGRTFSELQFQIQFVAELRLTLRKDVTVWATINEEPNARACAKHRAMGVLPGVSDLTFRWGPPLQQLHLELKAGGRKPTEQQLLFGARAKLDGAYYEWCDSLDAAVGIVKKYGLLK